VRAAEAVGDAEPLGRAHGDVGAQLPGRAQQGERQQVGGHDQLGAALFDLRGQRGQVAHGTAGARVLHQRPEERPLGQAGGQIGDHDLDAQRQRAGAHHLDGLRQHIGVHQEGAAGLGLGQPVRQRHRLGRGGALIQHGGVGHRQAGQVGHHGLEVQQRLQPALGDLRLVGGVGGVPAGVLQHVAQDHPGGDGAVVAQPDHGGQHPVAGGQLTQPGQGGALAERGRQPQRAGGADRLGHRVVDQRVDVGVAEIRQHARAFVGGRSDVPVGERGLCCRHRWGASLGCTAAGAADWRSCGPPAASGGR